VLLRIHRPLIVNIDWIAEIEHPSSREYYVKLRSGECLRLVDRHRMNLAAALGEF
jgi:DNA-binding LytR/AlgR family response regulator